MSNSSSYMQTEEYQNRLKKLGELRQLGIEPYPHKYTPTNTSQDVFESYKNVEVGGSQEAEEGRTPSLNMAGRLVLYRAMGKNAFAHLQDATGRLQVMFNRDHTLFEGFTPSPGGEESLTPLKLIEKKIDLGDILGLEGHLFRTHKGELTLYVKKATLLCKTLLPLAEKHAGLHDKEIRYRKRWLDLISNSDVSTTFRQRSLIFKATREFLENEGFIEVETPVLQSLYGGAEARPFLTKLNALNQEMFLRISLEIALKKLIVGGLDRVYEIGRVFRNEGIDRNHNPEFTLLEAYAAYWDYNDVMKLVENLVEKLCLQLHGQTKVKILNTHTGNLEEVDVKAPWPRLTMKQSILQFGGINVDTKSDEELYKLVLEGGHIPPEKQKLLNRGLMIGALFEIYSEPKLIAPHHILDHPIETTPFCKLHRNPKDRDKGLVERFESFMGGAELCNAYSELNDPLLQRELLEKQAERLAAGDEEASPFDEEFVEAICQGMPPTGGVGIGMDRLVMLLTSSHSLRDVLFFPLMKPQE